MPRQNRVTPFGEIIATPERGTFMGNRGVLHDGRGRILRGWQLKRWLICALEFRGRWRAVMTPGRYTELFFLDEATALAAGHRPCAECRRERFNAFREAWRTARPGSGSRALPTAEEIDRQLHAERVAPDRSKALFRASLEELPNGVMVTRADWGEEAYLLRDDRLLAWTAAGYMGGIARPSNSEVLVLTPKSTVGAIRAGYVPQVHASAEATA
jgi:hypothetical protein